MINEYEYTMTTELFKVHEFQRETAVLKLDPGMSDWRDLTEDSRSCQRRNKIDFFVQRDPKRGEYWLHGAPSAMQQYDSLAMKAAVRQGYRGRHHVVCLLESLRKYSSVWIEEREEPSQRQRGRIITLDGLRGRAITLPPTTGLWRIESVFSATVDLFMKYEALREIALAPKAQPLGVPSAMERVLCIDDIKADIKAALAEGNMHKAVDFGLDLQRAQGRKASKAAIYNAVGMDRSYFYASVRAGKPGSAPYETISRALMESAWLNPKKTKPNLADDR